jgi:predicted GIY-YIG superfamily endonuclease
MSMPWVLYILECADGTFYTGITNDLDQRLQKHESGTGAKYTKGRGPFKLAYLETLQNRSEASKREIAVKALRREEKLKLIGKRQG